MERNYNNPQRCPYCGASYPSWNREYTEHLVRKHPIFCQEVKEKLPFYCSGTLEDETDERVIHHISDCKGCETALSEYINKELKKLSATHSK